MPNVQQIVLSQFSILGLFGHNLLVRLDEAGQVMEELDGLATSRQGRIKPVGYLPSDRLKVYRFSRPYLFQPQQPQVLLFSGCAEQVEQRWLAAWAGAEAINALHLGYPILGMGRNSNSVTSTLIACMGLAEPALPRGRWAPGKGCLLLAPARIASLRKTLTSPAA